MTAVQSSPAPMTVPYEREEMIYEEDYVDVGELSDSPSSKPSFSSRPHTPTLSLSLSHSNTDFESNPTQSKSTKIKQDPEQPLALAAKAERILGLIPGTLQHARAALENARDEVRRTADSSAPFSQYTIPPSEFSSSGAGAGAGGIKGKMSRARKAMSVSLANMPNVVIGIGGREELVLRERRRRAVDGVLYWQKEVARLEAVEIKSTATAGKKGRR